MDNIIPPEGVKYSIKDIIETWQQELSHPTLEEMSIVDKEGEKVSPAVEAVVKNILDKYWNHPKFKAYFDKILWNSFAYGVCEYNPSEVDRIMKEIDEELKNK